MEKIPKIFRESRTFSRYLWITCIFLHLKINVCFRLFGNIVSLFQTDHRSDWHLQREILGYKIGGTPLQKSDIQCIYLWPVFYSYQKISVCYRLLGTSVSFSDGSSSSKWLTFTKGNNLPTSIYESGNFRF